MDLLQELQIGRRLFIFVLHRIFNRYNIGTFKIAYYLYHIYKHHIFPMPCIATYILNHTNILRDLGMIYSIF